MTGDTYGPRFRPTGQARSGLDGDATSIAIAWWEQDPEFIEWLDEMKRQDDEQD